MRIRNELKIAFMFSIVLVLFCASSSRARAELARAEDFEAESFEDATAGNYSRNNGSRGAALPSPEDECFDEEPPEDENTGIYAADISLTATPGSFWTREKEERALAALEKGYAVVGPTALMEEELPDAPKEDVLSAEISSSAQLTGPNTVQISLTVSADPKKFYSFEIGRKDQMNPAKLHQEESNVRILLPDYSRTDTSLIIDTVRPGMLTIDAAQIKRLRYGAARSISITWTISGAEAIADFGSELIEDTLFLNLGGEYILSGGDSDTVVNYGLFPVSGLSEAVRIGGCAHTNRSCLPIDEHIHSQACADCGYSFQDEEHHIEKGRCRDCGFEVIVSGTVTHILNGRTVTEDYSGVEEDRYVPKSFPGYFPPEPVTIPKGGGPISVTHQPISYTLVSGEREYTLQYDESLFLAGEQRKGFTFEGYTVAQVIGNSSP